MNLSTLVKKNVAEFLFLLGLLFVAFALYMSREFAMSYWYVGIGLVFSVYGVGIDFVRLRHRNPDESQKTIIHNRIAELIFLLGLLFVAFALYMIREFGVSLWHVIIGLGFCVYGVGIEYVRLQNRKACRPPSQQATLTTQ